MDSYATSSYVPSLQQTGAATAKPRVGTAMIRLFCKLLAFVKRDVKTELSYRLAFSGQVLGVFFQLGMFYFISRVFQGALVGYLKPYHGDYFSFVLIGLAFSGYVGVGLHTFSRHIREAQMQGTLEALLSTPTPTTLILLASCLWPMLWTSVQVGLYLLVGVTLFRAAVTLANPLGALLLFPLTILPHAAIGMLSASIIMIYKRGNPLQWLIGSGSLILGGVYYPVEVLPGWLKAISYVFPLTHALRGMRKAVLLGAPFSEISEEIRVLTILSALLMPVALFVLSKAVKKARMDGTLVHY